MEFIVEQKSNERYIVNLCKFVKSGMFSVEVFDKTKPINPIFVALGLKGLDNAVAEYKARLTEYLGEV